MLYKNLLRLLAYMPSITLISPTWQILGVKPKVNEFFAK